MVDPSSPPLRLGNYEPLLELASGGMATVYVARQLGAAGFERIVVVKRVHRHLLGNREFYDMFRDEARVASMVHHPNVVPVIDVVEVAQQERELFLVMEYVESTSLATLRKAVFEGERKFPVPVAARILYDALAGLHAAHEAVDMRGAPLGVVHRDVSPQNIIIGVDGSSRLIDFGVAKAAHRLTETKSGSVKGKYSYMAPEQALGQDVDRRTDLFAAGVVLHETLTGKRLFRGENELDTVRRIMESEIPRPSSLEPSIWQAVDAVVLKALSRPREQRYSTALEMMEALESVVPLASHREVAAFLEDLCGTRLQARREALREMLEGRIAPLAVDLPADPGESQPSRSVHLEPSPEGTGTEGRIAQVTEANRLQPARTKLTIAAVAASALAVGAMVVITVTSRTSSRGTSPPASGAATTSTTVASAAPAPPPPPPPASAPEPTSFAHAGEVELDLTADGPIESLRASGMKRMEISGASARAALEPWTGTLKVEATLEGGKKVFASVDSGKTSAHLDVKTHGAVATPPPTNKPDLQGNPYGTP